MLAWKHLRMKPLTSTAVYNGLLVVERDGWRGAVWTSDMEVVGVEAKQAGALVIHRHPWLGGPYETLYRWDQFTAPINGDRS